jgi:hypothetical protein
MLFTLAVGTLDQSPIFELFATTVNFQLHHAMIPIYFICFLRQAMIV